MDLLPKADERMGAELKLPDSRADMDGAAWPSVSNSRTTSSVYGTV